jgi:predicted  nucleic acid-binding Zn-ribbon protein
MTLQRNQLHSIDIEMTQKKIEVNQTEKTLESQSIAMNDLHVSYQIWQAEHDRLVDEINSIREYNQKIEYSIAHLHEENKQVENTSLDVLSVQSIAISMQKKVALESHAQQKQLKYSHRETLITQIEALKHRLQALQVELEEANYREEVFEKELSRLHQHKDELVALIQNSQRVFHQSTNQIANEVSRAD